ncbi:MAG: putative Ig domain-containing protein [Desulfuromonadaceae bacterium]|nr:putative Ig domain-containing protein [Desulfuromonadaceae bacterium]
MKIHRMITMGKFGLMLALFCLWNIPTFAAAGTVPAIPTGPLDAQGRPATPDYYTTANWANSPPLAKFVDTLPGIGFAKKNNLGQYLPVAKPDVTTYPGSDYYEINLVEYREQMHSDLPAAGTLLRGYVQVNQGTNLSAGTLPSQNLCGADQHACTAADTASGTGLTPDPVHYLGPMIISERDRPVRIKFTNRLPSGTAGDLFIPTDTTVMGAGPGPANPSSSRGVSTPCDNTQNNNTCASYTQNRAVIHLHGGRTPWISDGTPHQWITPVEENTPFTKGVSFQNVPDMPDPGDGSMTYYYTNQQSARMMFYHDHVWGITRLNVYAGGAAGYLITDKYEEDLKTRGIIPPDQIPLVLQDKTYVDATPVTHPVTGATNFPKIRLTDPLWNWGSAPAVNGVRAPVTGDLWLPHVYMPAQTLAAGFGGVNPYGRWMYGPWFYPATAVTYGPVANPYFDADCTSDNPFIYAQCSTPGQPPLIPGTPNVSMGMEAFQDSAVVNGTAFPTLTVDPRAYRFRVLNAASDRFFNLSFYKADPAQLSPDTRLLAANRSNKTEVKMVTASAELAAQAALGGNPWPEFWPVDGRDGGVPDPALAGPSFIQIGTDSGFLPKPVVINPQPITYNIDPTAFWVGNVDKMGLAVGPAERVDVLVDFSNYAGQTLILYNDAPAAWPAGVAGYDYYTGAPDMRDSGGFGNGGTYDPATGSWVGGHGPLVGYAPNTRTVMQVIVRASAGTDPAYTFSQANLEKEFTSAAPVTALNPAPAKTLFERAQEPIIVGQAAYKDAYPNSFFPTNFPWEGINQINDQFLQFKTLAGESVKVPTEPKGIHDEMGASFDPIYGRMSGNLAMQLPNPTTLNANLILYGFSDIPTETINDSTQVNVSVVPGTQTLADGTQIWKISHNGVDTHPIHFHIFDVQVINRVGWDGQILMPEPNELGWKEVVKISPLEDTIVAVRPRTPALPFGITNSLRPLNPAIPIDSPMGFNSVDWTTGNARTPVVTNVMYDFGWEYVWHCHILSHEEMDMMRPIVLKYNALMPPAFSAKAVSNNGAVTVTWTDPTPVTYTSLATYGNPANEIGYNVYSSTDGGATYTKLNSANLLANSTSYTVSNPVAGAVYKVEAFNAKGSTFSGIASPLSVSVAASGTFTAPGSITLTATLSGGLPSGATISQIAFYEGANLIGVDPTPASAPYAYTWTGVATGTHTITASVTDSLGGVAVSAPIDVIVTGALTASFTTTPISGSIGFCDTIAFNSTSTASTGSITGYSWLIQGLNYSTQNVNNITLPIGTYPVTLGVIDSGTGETAQVTNNVTVINHNPTAIPGGPYTVLPGGSVTLAGSGTDTLDACNTAPLTYAWNVDNAGAYDYFTANPTISYNTLKTVLGVGTHTMTFKVTDSNGGVGIGTTTVTVVTLISINTTSPLPTYRIGTGNYYKVITSSGGVAPFTWSVTAGALPVGITLTPTTGLLTGATTTPGTYNFTLQVADSTTSTVSKAFTLTVLPGALAITTTSPLPTYRIGTGNYYKVITNSGGVAPFTWSVTAGALPVGITLTPTTGLLTGATTTPGTYNFTLQVADSTTSTVSKAFTLTVLPGALAITTTSPLPTYRIGTGNYYKVITNSGGVAPFTWSVTAGALPVGITLTPTTGLLTGATTTPGTYNFTLQVADSTTSTVSKAFTLDVF